MKPLLIVFLLCTTSAISAAQQVTKPAPRPRLAEALRHQAIQPSSTQRPSSAAGRSTKDAPAIAQYRYIELNHGMVSRIDAPPPANRAFTLREGGTYWGKEDKRVTTELMLQYDASSKGWDLFKISW